MKMTAADIMVLAIAEAIVQKREVCFIKTKGE